MTNETNENGENNRVIDDITAEESLSLGDSHYVDENYEEAVNAYAAAISLAERDGSKSNVIQIRSLSHRSAAFYQLGRYAESLDDADSALKLCNKQKGSDGQIIIPKGLKPGETEMFHKRIGLAALKLKRYLIARFSFISAKQLAMLNKRGGDQVLEEYQQYIDSCMEQIKGEKEQRSSQSTKTTPVPESSSPTEKPTAATTTSTTRTTPTSTSSSRTTASMTTASEEPTMPKYQYYQSDKVMTISILERQVQQDQVNVTFEKKRLVVLFTKKNKQFTVIAGTLYSEVDVDRCKVVIKDEKVLIKLRKIDPHEWHELLSKKDDAKKPTVVAAAAAADATTSLTDEKEPNTANVSLDEQQQQQEQQQSSSATTNNIHSSPSKKPTPYASTKDWDKIERDLKEEEDKETPVGDEALNKLFQQIYGNASDETRRAMVKSYQTSGGTVLSTNWDEVSKKDYEKERTAPKGCEWKTWEGDKLPMKDDD